MAGSYWRPFHQLDDLLEDVSFKKRTQSLATDIYEENGVLFLKMHAAGVDPDKIEITMENEHLKISGSREHEIETEDQHYFHKEIRSGSFERIFPLPMAVDTAETRAEYRDGVLTVALPIKEEKKTTKIKISKK